MGLSENRLITCNNPKIHCLLSSGWWFNPLKNMSSSVGMMTFIPIYGKS